MNYTENYHLPQWVKEDRIMMEDFNQMCRDMEAGLNKTASDAAAETASGVKSAADAASRAASAAAQAQKTADSALSKANAAYSPSQQPYVVGTYTGNGETLTVTLGFQPKFLIISRQFTMSGYDSPCSSGFAMAGCGLNVTGLSILSNGFTVASVVLSNTDAPPHINRKGSGYAYIAFR